MRRPAAFLAILAALACHPAAQGAGEALPSKADVEPIVACVWSSLADVPNVREVRFVKDYPRTVWVIFWNPPDPQTGGMKLLVAPDKGTPKQFVVEYSLWTGTTQRPGVPNMASLNAPAVEATGSLLLSGVRNRCAPKAAGTPSCSMSNFRDRINGRCSIGI
jgi:hypothetical protein